MKTRIPHLGHLALFLALTFASFLLAEALFLLLTPGPYQHALGNQRLQLVIEAVAYLFTLGAALWLFPRLWQGPFFAGLQWNRRAARPWLIPAGLGLGLLAQLAETRLPIPKSLPVDALLDDRALLPILAVLAVLIAPLMEEIVFRGLLLPAAANAYDYLRLSTGSQLPEQALAQHEAWRLAPGQSTPALVLASAITSLLFALMHAPQLGYTWPAVSLLLVVSVILCVVRIRCRSVAASTLVHSSYNLSVFLTLAWVTDGFRHMDKLH